MKRILKRVLSVTLTVVMILTAVPFLSYATENEATVEQGNDDVSVSATNSLGAMITETLEDENLGVDSDYVITDLTFEGNTATVSYMALENCNLVVAVYDENTMQMLTSEVVLLSAEEVYVCVTFTEALPEYFIAKAFLVDLDYAPLCKEYVSRKNTTEFVEFMATKSTDFEEDKVINLDNNEDNNFLVLSGEAQKIKGDTETNVLVSSDVETNTYVFENIDSNISSLKKGDIFHLDNGDMANLVVIKVASISIDGSTATIVAEASSLEEVFEFVKLDSDELKYNVSTDSAESGIITEDGSFEADAWESTNEGEPWTKTEFYPFEDELENEKGDKVVINGSATFTLEARYKIYIDRKWAEISFILNPSAVLTVTVSGSFKEREIKLGHIYFGMYGVTIGAEPVLVLSASGSITLTGTWKTQIGFSFNTNDGFVNKSKPTTFDPEVNITGEFYVGFNLSPYLSFMRAKNSSVVDIKFKTEIGVTIKATYSNSSGHACLNCIDGDLLWSAKLDIDLAILYGLIDTSDNKNYKENLWNKKPAKFADFYYSFDHNEFGWGECPHSVRESGQCGANLTWTYYNDKKLVISGTGAMYEYVDNNFNDRRPWKKYKVSIKSIVIGDGVTSISDFAFWEFANLVSAHIGNTVTSIGKHSFSNCFNLESINIPSSVKRIGSYAFFLSGKMLNIVIPDGVSYIEDKAFYESNIEKFIVDENNAYYSSDSYGVLYNKYKTNLIQYPINNLADSFRIPDGVLSIGTHAFSFAVNLISIEIPNSTTTLHDNAFYRCTNLAKILISDSVATIGNETFFYCYNLVDIYYTGTPEQWRKISMGSDNGPLTWSTTNYHFNYIKDSVNTEKVVLDSTETEIITVFPYCFEVNGIANNSYTLVTVTEMSVPLALSNKNILYFDRIIANDCGMISTDFLPKAQVDGCVTLLIGDFGSGTEARVVTTTTYTAGDINLDTSFDGMDAVVVACVVNGMLTEELIGTKKFEIADANLDGVIDTLDITYLENKGLYLS